MTWLHPPWLGVGVLLALAGVLAARWARARRRRDLGAYLGPAGPAGRAPHVAGAPGRAALRTGLTAAGLAALAAALAGPLHGAHEETVVARGADVVLAVDVSPSMGAADAKPDRLRLAVHRAGALLDALPGHRVGLVAFSGGADVLVPLTLDHDAVRMGLEALEPGMVPRRGSSLQEGLTAAAGALRDAGGGGAVVVLSDGEATEGDIDRAIRAARRADAVVFALGVGATAGAPVPERDPRGVLTGYKRDKDGHVVTSRLDRAPLESLATATGGTYHDGALGQDGTASVAAALRDLNPASADAARVARPEDRYQWPLAAAFLILAVDLLMPALPRRRRVA